MPDTVTVALAIQAVQRALSAAGIVEAGGDARRLIAAAAGVSGAELLSHPERVLTAEQVARLEASAARRAGREPVSRIVGMREFYGRPFAISPDVLDPRPDSETVITAVLQLVREEGWGQRALRIVDVGTGSGCLLATLLLELPSATGTGIDISQPALDIARGNWQALGVGGRAESVIADGLDGCDGRYDILVSNPPYIPTRDIPGLEPEVRDFDPLLALDGGVDGLSFYRRILPEIHRVVPGGWAILEIGHDQAAKVTALAAESGFGPGSPGIRIFKDLAGRCRCVAVGARG
jgi:release factor glutamine methyltransferase